jgi:hypothetical protein
MADHGHDICPVCKHGFTKKRQSQQFCCGSCRWKASKSDLVVFRLSKLSPELRAQLAAIKVAADRLTHQ